MHEIYTNVILKNILESQNMKWTKIYFFKCTLKGFLKIWNCQLDLSTSTSYLVLWDVILMVSPLNSYVFWNQHIANGEKTLFPFLKKTLFQFHWKVETLQKKWKHYKFKPIWSLNILKYAKQKNHPWEKDEPTY